MTKLHPTQETYLKVKAAYEAAEADLAERMKPHLHLYESGNDADFDKYMDIEEKMAAEAETWAFFDLLKQAEDAMITWAVQKVARTPAAKAHQETIKEVYEAAMVKRLPRPRQQLIEISAKLAVR